MHEHLLSGPVQTLCTTLLKWHLDNDQRAKSLLLELSPRLAEIPLASVRRALCVTLGNVAVSSMRDRSFDASYRDVVLSGLEDIGYAMLRRGTSMQDGQTVFILDADTFLDTCEKLWKVLAASWPPNGELGESSDVVAAVCRLLTKYILVHRFRRERGPSPTALCARIALRAWIAQDDAHNGYVAVEALTELLRQWHVSDPLQLSWLSQHGERALYGTCCRQLLAPSTVDEQLSRMTELLVCLTTSFDSAPSSPHVIAQVAHALVIAAVRQCCSGTQAWERGGLNRTVHLLSFFLHSMPDLTIGIIMRKRANAERIAVFMAYALLWFAQNEASIQDLGPIESAFEVCLRMDTTHIFASAVCCMWSPIAHRLSPAGVTGAEAILPYAMWLWIRIGRAVTPFAQGVTNETTSHRCSSEQCICAHAKPPHKLYRCKGCYSAIYCNRTCQRSHWEAGHRLACGTTFRMTREPSEDPSTSGTSTVAGTSFV